MMKRTITPFFILSYPTGFAEGLYPFIYTDGAANTSEFNSCTLLYAAISLTRSEIVGMLKPLPS